MRSDRWRGHSWAAAWPDTTQRIAAVAAVAVTVAAWASAFLVIRGLRGSFAPGALALGRLLVGSLCLGAVTAARGAWVRPTRREWLLAALCGLAWFGAYNVALNAAERRVDAGTAAMLVNVGPILVALLAGWLLKEGFARRLWTGAGLACAGVVVIGAASAAHGAPDVAGALLCVIAASGAAIGITAQKAALVRMSALQVTQIGCAVGALVCAPFAGQVLGERPSGLVLLGGLAVALGTSLALRHG